MLYYANNGTQERQGEATLNTVLNRLSRSFARTELLEWRKREVPSKRRSSSWVQISHNFLGRRPIRLIVAMWLWWWLASRRSEDAATGSSDSIQSAQAASGYPAPILNLVYSCVAM